MEWVESETNTGEGYCEQLGVELNGWGNKWSGWR